MKRAIIAALVTVALVMGATVPAEAATKKNWLRHCTSHTTTSCVVEGLSHGPDSKGRGITFHTSRGHVVTIHSKARAWRVVKQHSHRCANQGSVSCYMRDDVTGLNFIVYPSGLHVALKRIK